MLLYLTLFIWIDHQALPACLKGLINEELDLIKQALEENPSAAHQYPDEIKVVHTLPCLKHATVHLKQVSKSAMMAGSLYQVYGDAAQDGGLVSQR